MAYKVSLQSLKISSKHGDFTTVAGGVPETGVVDLQEVFTLVAEVENSHPTAESGTVDLDIPAGWTAKQIGKPPTSFPPGISTHSWKVTAPADTKTATIVATAKSRDESTVSTSCIAGPSQIAFLSSQSQFNAIVGSPTSQIVIQTTNSLSQAQNPGNPVTIALSTTRPSGSFFLDAQCTKPCAPAQGQPATVTINPNTSNVAFYYLDILAGPQTITATVTAPAAYKGSTATVDGMITPVSTTTSLVSSTNNTAQGTSVTFTATVSANPPSKASPTGSVSFTADGTQLGSGPASLSSQGAGSASASVTTSSLPPGPPHSIVANYNPQDGSFTSSGASLSFTVPTALVTITGNIVTAGGSPVSGVPVTAKGLDGKEIASSKSTSGTYSLLVPSGAPVYVVFPTQCTGPDGQTTLYIKTPESSYMGSASAVPPLPNTIYERRACQFSGVVMQQVGNNSQPLGGVQAALTDLSDPTKVYQSITDAQGNFCFNPPTGSRFTLQLPATATVGKDTFVLSNSNLNSNPMNVSVQADAPTPLPNPFVYSPQLSMVFGQVTDGQKGLDGVEVELSVQGRQRTQVTRANGIYQFPNVPPGAATVRFPSPATVYGTSWELQAGQQATQSFSIRSGQVVPVATAAYQPEGHSIEQLVLIEGQPAEGVLVDVRCKGAQYALQSQRTGKDGKATFALAAADQYEVRVYPDPAAAGGPQVNFVEVNSQAIAPIVNLPRPGGAGGGRGPQGGSREPVSDLQSFPVLTQDFSPSALPSASTPGPAGPIGGTSPLGLAADKAIREVLSWRTKGDDPKGFVGALNTAFALRDVEGHTEWTWTPRSYTVQTDMGAVTGAQASIYTRAKVALDQSLPLLDGLSPLVPNVEPEDLATVQAVVRSQFTALVNEFGVVGGPRVPRVDELFDLLLSKEVAKHHDRRPDPEDIPRAGSLGLVRERFGLRRKDVTTVEDEQNLTNYLILVDYVIGLWQSWNYDRDFFVRTFLGESDRDPFFGTQLVLISRALEVVAQGVQDAYYTMDSVFMGDAERQTTQLDFAHLKLDNIFIPDGRGNPVPLDITDSKSGLFVAELLDWVYQAASEELPALLQDAGKDGLESFKASTDRLRRFIHAARIPPQHAPALPPGYRTPRVQRALQLLADGLDEAYGLAHQIHSPDLPVAFTEEEVRDLRKMLQQPHIRG